MFIKDETGSVVCPYCCCGDKLKYNELYEARIHWEGGLYPQHDEVGTLLQFLCNNCDFEFYLTLDAHRRAQKGEK